MRARVASSSNEQAGAVNTVLYTRTASAFRTRSITSLAASTEARQVLAILPMPVSLERYKGSDIASVDRAGRPIRFFDPRRDIWDEHFKLNGPVIQPITPVGEVTARVLRLNASERVIERQLRQALGQYRRD